MPIIQIAVEDWSQENGGEYPTRQPGKCGRVLADRLLARRSLANPFHLAKTEPVDGAAAAQGQVGYLPIHADGWSEGYVVTAYGEHGEILNLTKAPAIGGSTHRPHRPHLADHGSRTTELAQRSGRT